MIDFGDAMIVLLFVWTGIFAWSLWKWGKGEDP